MQHSHIEHRVVVEHNQVAISIVTVYVATDAHKLIDQAIVALRNVLEHDHVQMTPRLDFYAPLFVRIVTDSKGKEYGNFRCVVE